ncbi:hypothetical protein ACKWTF_015552 [Chironomus riparius]
MEQTFSLAEQFHVSSTKIRIKKFKDYYNLYFDKVTSQTIKFEKIPVSWNLTLFSTPVKSESFYDSLATKFYYQLDIKDTDRTRTGMRFYRSEIIIDSSESGAMKQNHRLFKPKNLDGFKKVNGIYRFDGFLEFQNDSYNNGGDLVLDVKVTAKDVEEFLALK